MKIDNLFEIFSLARKATGHSDFVVVGSLAVLGIEFERAIPSEMTMSNDIDSFTRDDPERIFDLRSALGEDSDFHIRHGYFLDPVSPRLPTLPEGWEGRLNKVERDGLRLWFLDPNDAAVSKYARGEPRDTRWIRAGISSGLVSLPTVRARFRTTTFLDVDEERRARALLDADVAWFERLKARRT